MTLRCVTSLGLILIGGAVAVGCGGGGGGGGASVAVAATTTAAVGTAAADQVVGLALVPPGDLHVAVGSDGFQVAVDTFLADGRARDATRTAELHIDDPKVATVSGDGLVQAVAPGRTALTVSFVDPSGARLTEVRSIFVAAAPSKLPAFTALEVWPSQRRLDEVDAKAQRDQLQQVVVTAKDATGRRWDLTRSIGLRVLAPGLGPTAAAQLSPSGLLRGLVDGEEVQAVARLDDEGLVAGGSFFLGEGTTQPLGGAALYHGGPLRGSANAIDAAVLGGLKPILVEPSALSSDDEFARRLFLDAIGRVPTEQELVDFRKDAAPDKRVKLVKALLATRDFADKWGARVGEWFMVPSLTNPRPPAVAFDRWAADQVEAKRTLAEIVTDLATGTGAGGQLFDGRHPSAADKVDALVLAGAGMTAKCAKCHDHPLTGPNDAPKWTQAERYPLDAFFATSNSDAIPLDKAGNRTGNNGQPFAPGFVLDRTATVTSTLRTPLATRRAELARLLVGSRAWKRGTAHRIWATVMTPLLDPNQLLRSNLDRVAVPAVLDALTDRFDACSTSLQRFLEEVFTSKTYQLTARGRSTTNDKLLARFQLRRDEAEHVTSIVERLTGQPPLDVRYVHETFGWPGTTERRTIDERKPGVHMGQPLVLTNSPAVQDLLVARGSPLATLAADVRQGVVTRDEAIQRLFRATLTRDADAAELALARDLLGQAPTVDEGLVDLAAGLLGTVEVALR